MAITIREKNIRHLSTRWLVGGQEEAEEILFFIHGFPDGPDSFSFQFDYFGQEYLILAPFLRGMDDAQKESIPKSRYSVDSHILDFLEIIKEHDPHSKKKIHIIAHDIGGLYAWRLASDLGASRATLVSLNAPSLQMMAQRLLSPTQLKKSWYIAFFQLPVISEKFWEKFEKKLIEKAYEASHISPPSLINLQRGLLLYREGLRSVLQTLRHNQKGHNLGKVLVISGDRDPYLNIPKKNELLTTGEPVTQRVIEGGHWIHREHPDKINQFLKNFFKK